MANLIPIELDYSIKVSSRVASFLSPSYIFLPYDKNCIIYCQANDYVLKGQPVIKYQDNELVSSISGRVLGLKTINAGKYLVIENDYKEKKQAKSINHLRHLETKAKLIKLLLKNNCNIDFLPAHYLLLNIIDPEPYLLNNTFYFKNNCKLILELLDMIKTLNNYQGVILLLKNTETEIIMDLNNILGTYPDFKIKTVPNYYLIDRSEFYSHYLDSPIKDILELKMKEIINLVDIVFYNQRKTEKYITITGNAVKNPLVINVKLGTQLKDVMKELIKLKEKESSLNYYLNGLLTGFEIPNVNLVITEDIEGIIICYPSPSTPTTCLKCGVCLKYCPLHLDPIWHQQHNIPLNCLACGLCTYLCPSNLNFKKITHRKETKDE